MSETAQQPAVGQQPGKGARLPRTARRAQLLAAAQDVFAANGYHAAAITADAGLDEERARLLAVGLVGASQVTAQSWLAGGRRIDKGEAVKLISTLAWRGIGGGYPLQHP